MLEHDRIDISEGIDVNKTNASKECDICHYWHFKDIDFRYEPCLCNGYHDLMQKARVLMMLLLFMLKEVFAEFIFGIWAKMMQLTLWIIRTWFIKSSFLIFSLYIKNEWLSLLQRNRDVILNRSNGYYENDKQKSTRQARDKYRNLSEEEKNKKREYGKNRYHNMSEEKLKE